MQPDRAEPKVVVVGAGPCGAILANLLGEFAIRTLLVDRELDVLDYPRAVGIDDESLRTLQAIGLAEAASRDMIANTPLRYYSSDGHCFAQVRPTERPFGWPRRSNFLQPLFERTLRDGLARYPTVETRYGCALQGLTQDEAGVGVELVDASGQVETVRTRYLVGADGGRSTVRRLTGIDLVGSTASSRWLVVDVKNDQLAAPYAAVHCHPQHPTMVIALPYRHRRFEFKLGADEQEPDVLEEETVLRRLEPFYDGLPLPDIARSRVYLHHSRVARSFQSGRVFLAGDAAHLQPPFFGQGMNSGVRDATNLAWKLAAVVRGQAGESVLASYDVERRKHATAMVSFATRIGQMYSPRNRATEVARDSLFRVVNRVPGARDYILQMKYKPMPDYTGGLVVPSGSPGSIVGRMAPQPVVEAPDGSRRRLDDVLGDWFAVVGIHCDPLEHLGEAGRAEWERLGTRFVAVQVPRAVPLEERGVAAAATTGAGSWRGADVDGVFADLALARPADQVLIVRPDRYVMAACRAVELDQVTGRIGEMLGP